jgi:outer membrane protein TolC
LLSAQRNAIELQSLRLQSTVGLIKALGGGFEEGVLYLLVQLPSSIGQAD